MSFRRRLTTFFIVIVLLPMLAIAVIVFRLISESEQARANARVNGILAAATSVYRSDERAATTQARTLAIQFAHAGRAAVRYRARTLVDARRIIGISVTRNGVVIANARHGAPLAPGAARVTYAKSTTFVRVSVTSATAFSEAVAAGNGIVVRQGTVTLAAVPSSAANAALPAAGNVTVAGTRYTVASDRLDGFSGNIELTALSPRRAVAAPGLNSSRALAAAFLAGFLILALAFAMLASRGLQGQLGRFLAAARRLAGGDFSSPVPVEGQDEFALLATEFNNMSRQLAERLEQLDAERGRLRESIRRAGQAFASNLDRDALLELLLKTAVDAAEGQFGRLSASSNGADWFGEVAREGSLDGFEQTLLAAEEVALTTRGHGEASDGEVFVAAAALGAELSTGRPEAVVTVGRFGRGFSDDDLDLLRSLAAQTTMALENVEMHEEAQHQAVTDKLTGLANHGRFQEVLAAEMEQVRRYGYPVGLIMLDIDDFKQVNDLYGHPQGDVVLQEVAQVLRDTSRDADAPARYGGEEMALILPHTDLEGSYAIAERVRTAIEALTVPRLDGIGVLRVTASLGVGATTEGDKATLIATTDAALYEAKRAGKNRTVRASMLATNGRNGE